MVSAGTQSALPLAFGMLGQPKDAPAAVVRRCESEAQAINVSLLAAKAKGAYVALALGVSEAQLSRYRHGQRHMPEARVGAFCAATGTNLLRQYRALQEMLADDETARLAAMLRAA